MTALQLGPGEIGWPAVSVVVPARDVAGVLERCLVALAGQDYDGELEVVVVDGRSLDATPAIAAAHGARVVDNPRLSRPAAMNAGISAARGEVVVRVDARTVVEPDYVRRCVEALGRSGAAMVGGPMRLAAGTALERGVAEAMSSRLGGGTARFRRPSPQAGFTDTVYLGAFRRQRVLELGGYDEEFGGNEDAELAHRMQRAGGVYLDPAIVSSYPVRPSLGELFEQYLRYGMARAGTLRKHPGSLSARQLAVPALAVGLISPWRRHVLAAYLLALAGRSTLLAARDPAAVPGFAAAVPLMHLGWALGLARSLAGLGRGDR